MTDNARGGVAGRCPSCGGTTLYLGSGGHVTCPRLDCRNPGAADDLLHGATEQVEYGVLLRGDADPLGRVLERDDEEDAKEWARDVDGCELVLRLRYTWLGPWVPPGSPAAPAPRDPTYGRIDADIQRRVDEIGPPNIGSRVAMENTLQSRRDQATADRRIRIPGAGTRVAEPPAEQDETDAAFALPLPSYEGIVDRLRTLRVELDDWSTGRRSWWNLYAGGDPERSFERQAACAEHDAAEVTKRARAIEGYVALLDAVERVEVRVDESIARVGPSLTLDDTPPATRPAAPE